MDKFIKCCPVCQSDAKNVKWIYKQWKITECCECELQFSWPFVPGNLEYYSEHQTYSELYAQVENGNIPPGNFAIVREIDNVVQSYISKSMDKIRILDYGCGSGFYGAHLKRRGCDVLCVDFNPEMVRVALEVFGLRSLIKSADELLSEGEGKYDLIILNQVLEHVGNPVKLLNTLGKLLNKEGVIFVSVPNRNFIRARSKLIQGRLPEANYPPHHITFWSVKSLSRVMSVAGLNVLKCLAQNYPDSVQTQISLSSRFGEIGGVTRIIASAAASTGRLLNLPGVNLFAIGSIDG